MMRVIERDDWNRLIVQIEGFEDVLVCVVDNCLTSMNDPEGYDPEPDTRLKHAYQLTPESLEALKAHFGKTTASLY